MKKNITYLSKVILYSMFVGLVFLSCDQNSSDEIKNDKNSLSELTVVNDSAIISPNEIEIRKDTVEIKNTPDVNKYESNNKIIQLKLDNVNKSINELEHKIKIIDDSLNQYAAKLTEVNFKIDELSLKKKYVSETGIKSKENITTNITELETDINALKISKSEEENNYNIILKTKELDEKKRELFKTELEFKETELNELYSRKNAEEEIKKVEDEISELNENIDQNKNQLLEDELNLKLSQNKISDLQNLINEKQKLFKTEYEKSTGFSDYVKKEQESVEKNLNRLNENRIVLSKSWKDFKTQKEVMLKELDDAKLVQQELVSQIVEVEQDSISNEKGSSLVDTGLTKTDDIVKEAEEIVDQEAIEKGDTLKEKNDAVQKLIAESKEPSENSSSFIYWFLIIGLIIVSALYWIGKKNRKNSK